GCGWQVRARGATPPGDADTLRVPTANCGPANVTITWMVQLAPPVKICPVHVSPVMRNAPPPTAVSTTVNTPEESWPSFVTVTVPGGCPTCRKSCEGTATSCAGVALTAHLSMAAPSASYESSMTPGNPSRAQPRPASCSKLASVPAGPRSPGGPCIPGIPCWPAGPTMSQWSACSFTVQTPVTPTMRTSPLML